MAIYDVNGNSLTADEKSNVLIPESGIFATCADIYSAYDVLVSGGFATKTLIATVNNLPMYRYDFSGVNKWASGGANAEDTSGNKLYTKLQALFFSGLHGDERGAPLYVYEFMKQVCYNPNYCWILAMFDVHIVPIGNPYGYNHNTRNNADNININRLDESSNTIEAQALMETIDSQSYDLFIDCHNCETDKSATQYVGVTGAFSLANDTPEAKEIKAFEKYLEATTEITRSLRKHWNMNDNNGVQNFLPWDGTENQTFRNYGYTHNVNGQTVGSPISACSELSRNSYTYSQSTTSWNDKSLIVGNTAENAILFGMLKAVYDGFFA